MLAFFTILICIWLLTCTLVLTLPHTRTRQVFAIAWPLAGIATFLVTSSLVQPWQRLLIGSVGLLYLLKASILLRIPQATLCTFSKLGLLLFMTAWPGMDPRPLRGRRVVQAPAATTFIQGWAWGCAGVGVGFATVLLQPALPAELVGWLGLAALLMLIHFGYANVLTAVLWLCGWNVAPLFRSPLRSRSLRDFWGHRWNVAFVEMNLQLFQRPLRRVLGKGAAVVAIFVVSGVLHELGISYPAGAGWGLPFAYFALQGVLVLLETRVLRVESRWSAWAARTWTWLAILAPLPLLFHAPFRATFILPLVAALHDAITARPIPWYLGVALYLAALGHACVLIASAQVPVRLRWKEDLAKLTPFNRKIMWTYGAFIVLCIVAFGALTWAFHDDFMRGERVALGLAGFIAVFWGLRVGVDTFYFRHADWPAGDVFTIGHLLLTSLFVALTATYTSLIMWHLMFAGS